MLRKHVFMFAKLLILTWIFLACKTSTSKHHRNIDDETDYDILDVFIAFSFSLSRSSSVISIQRPRFIQFKFRFVIAISSAFALSAFDDVFDDNFQMLNIQQLLSNSMFNDFFSRTFVWKNIKNQFSMNEDFEEKIETSQIITTDNF